MNDDLVPCTAPEALQGCEDSSHRRCRRQARRQDPQVPCRQSPQLPRPRPPRSRTRCRQGQLARTKHSKASKSQKSSYRAPRTSPKRRFQTRKTRPVDDFRLRFLGHAQVANDSPDRDIVACENIRTILRYQASANGTQQRFAEITKYHATTSRGTRPDTASRILHSVLSSSPQHRGAR